MMAGARISRAALGVSLMLATGVAWVSGARAQDPTADDVEMARELFRSGIDAAEDSRWNEARLAFERSYELAPRSSTLFNLANAQVELGDLVGAATSYRLFLDQATGTAARYRPDAEEALAEIEPRIAEVTVALSPSVEGDFLEVDGAPAPVDVAIPMNPGPHHLLVRRGDAVVGESELTLVEGEQRGLSLPVRAPAPALAVESLESDAEEELVASPWLWLGVGAGVAVLTAVVLGIAFAASGTEAAFEGNFGPGSVVFE